MFEVNYTRLHSFKWESSDINIVGCRGASQLGGSLQGIPPRDSVYIYATEEDVKSVIKKKVSSNHEIVTQKFAPRTGI